MSKREQQQQQYSSGGRGSAEEEGSSSSSTSSSSTGCSSNYSTNAILRNYENAHILDRISGPPNASLLYEPKRKFSPYVSLGPIIGMVSETIARVLIETSEDVKVRCFLTDSHGVQHGVANYCRKNTPTVFLFEELRADTEFKVSFNIPVPGLVRSSVRTLPPNWGSAMRYTPARDTASSSNPAHEHTRAVYAESVVDGVQEPRAVRRGECARIAAVSNHDLASGQLCRPGSKNDLWRKLYKEHRRNPIDYLLILGNLVYVDTADYVETKEGRMPTKDNNSVFLDAIDLAEDLSPDQYEEVRERILEMFRKVYRTTLTHPTLRHVLANIPCLAIPGEMELGLWLDDEKDLARRFVQECAYQVYNEYLRALFEDDSGISLYDTPHGRQLGQPISQAYHFHAFGDIGFMLLDTRAHVINHRSTKHLHETPYLGYRQWADIDYALSESGYLSLCRTIIVGSVTPVAHAGENVWLSASIEKQMELLNTWGCGDGIDEASLLLCKLFDWKNRKGSRDVCFMCGNQTNGGISQIKDKRYSDRVLQIVAGPIASKKHKGITRLTNTSHRGIGVYHNFKHTKVSDGNAFAYADVKISADLIPEISGGLIF